MAQVTGMTAAKIEELTDGSVVGGHIDPATGTMTLQTRDGQNIEIGSVGTVAQAYPVGSLYLSTVSTNPSSLLGFGTWVAWGTGRMPVGVDSSQPEFAANGQTGGEKTHTLTLTEIPQHDHSMVHTHPIDHDHQQTNTRTLNYAATTTTGGTAVRVTDLANATGGGGSSANVSFTIPPYSGASGASSTAKTGTAGGNAGVTAPHNNLPPYITCYMWRRTS